MAGVGVSGQGRQFLLGSSHLSEEFVWGLFVANDSGEAPVLTKCHGAFVTNNSLLPPLECGSHLF